MARLFNSNPLKLTWLDPRKTDGSDVIPTTRRGTLSARLGIVNLQKDSTSWREVGVKSNEIVAFFPGYTVPVRVLHATSVPAEYQSVSNYRLGTI